MASLEQRNGIYRIVFRYAGRRYSQTLATADQSVAAGLKASLEQRLKLVKGNVIPRPADNIDIAGYLIHGTSVPTTQSKSIASASFVS